MAEVIRLRPGDRIVNIKLSYNGMTGNKKYKIFILESSSSQRKEK